MSKKKLDYKSTAKCLPKTVRRYVVASKQDLFNKIFNELL